MEHSRFHWSPTPARLLAAVAAAVFLALPAGAVIIDSGDGTFADLKVFAISPDPGLPELPIRSNPNLPTGTVIMIGRGRDRGAATDSDDPAVWVPPPESFSAVCASCDVWLGDP